jgi:replication factor A1
VFLAIIDEILSKRPDLSADQVRALIEEKKRELPNFLSDEGAARLVAEELLIKTSGTQLGRMQIKDLVNGLNDVAISGRVLAAWAPQTFQRRDGSSGKVMRLIIVDKSGRVHCALWDKHVEVVSKSNLQGGIIRISHAYTRQGLAGDVEAHAGDRSSVEVNPQEMPTTDFPEFKEFFKSINEIPGEINQVSVVGVVQVEPRRHSFAKDDRVGTVLNTIIADQSGKIPLVAWNDRAEDLRDLKRGDILQIVNARTRLNQNSNLELHVETRSLVSVLHQPPDYLKLPPEQQTSKITDLTTQSSLVDLIVSIISKGESREIKRSTGELLRVSSILVGDDTGMLTLSLWDDKADLVKDFIEDDVLRLRGVSVRERLGDLQLNLGKSGELEKVHGVQKLTPPTSRIDTLSTAKGLLTVEGTVIDQPVIRQVSTEKGETINVTSFTLKGETGSTRVTLWRDHASLAKELTPNCKLRLTGVRLRSGLNGQMELNSIPLTKISVLLAPIERPAWEDIRKIISLEAGLATWIKGQVVEAGDHKIRIDDGTGVTDIMWDESLSDQITVILEGIVGKELEIFGTAEKIDENKLIFKATKVLSTTK